MLSTLDLGTCDAALVAVATDLPELLVVHCGHGQWAMTAASLLRNAGYGDAATTTADADQLAAVAGGGR